MPESIASSVVPKAFFGNSDPGSRKLSKEEQMQLVIDHFCMTKFCHYQSDGIKLSTKELQSATCNKACSKCGQLHLITNSGG